MRSTEAALYDRNPTGGGWDATARRPLASVSDNTNTTNISNFV